jgi:hypothetical protein
MTEPRSGVAIPGWAWSGLAELRLLTRAGYGHTRPFGINTDRGGLPPTLRVLILLQYTVTITKRHRYTDLRRCERRECE